MTRAQLYQNFADNIELERNRLSLTQQKMADALQISLSKYKILITNPFEANIDIYLAHQIQKLTGKTVRELCGDDLPELEMVRHFRELPKHRQEAIKYLIEIEYELSKCKKRDKEEDLVTCYVATGNMEDGMILDSRDLTTVDISHHREISREKIDCAVKVTSNHLHPVYMKGDILLIGRRAPRDGDIGIFILKETSQVFIREFKQTSPCELRPINGYGDIIYVDGNNKIDMNRWIKFGTVLTVMR